MSGLAAATAGLYMTRVEEMAYYFPTHSSTFYEKIYPFRKALLIAGSIGLACGMVTFIVSLALISTKPLDGESFFLFVGAIALLCLGTVLCQCRQASGRWHQGTQQAQNLEA